MTGGCEEIWEPHPVYPHEGSSLGRIRTLKGKILNQRPNNRPEGAPPDQRYQLIDIWMPRPPCILQENGRWKHLKPGCKCKETVSVHTFITECHWGLKKYRRQVARHGPGGPADNCWVNLKGWGFPEDNEADKPPEVRAAAAKTARAAQMAQLGQKPRRKRRRRSRKVTLRVSFRLPWPQKKRRVTADREPVTNTITNEGPVTGRKRGSGSDRTPRGLRRTLVRSVAATLRERSQGVTCRSC